jgi:hypothetical protein
MEASHHRPYPPLPLTKSRQRSSHRMSPTEMALVKMIREIRCQTEFTSLLFQMDDKENDTTRRKSSGKFDAGTTFQS